MMQEDYVTFEQAKLLKEKGFPQDFHFPVYEFFMDFTATTYHPLQGTWKLVKDYIDTHRGPTFVHTGEYATVNAPTLALAQKWLREKKNIFLHIIPIYTSTNVLLGWTFDFNNFTGNNSKVIETYEQALSEGIDKALELI